ncbi:MAG: 5-oxoprolinase subunit PxpB [Spirochaetaceae bacterium]|jgi:KipI family sensor histidine kinase inhibitor|nr:5-oxoprolinase subunit PxpB [Spirochaetaceae bacterium]
MDIYPAGDGALCVEFGRTISAELNDRVHALAGLLQDRPLPGVLDLVPAYASLLVCFDPLCISSRSLRAALWRRVKEAGNTGFGSRETVYIPVCYDEPFSPDMEKVAAHTGLSPWDIISRHTKPVYRIYMLGFLPGFPYLGGLDPVLETPRLAKPRIKIPAGAVGIGGAQTGIYPLESPGGWNLIGQTPVRPYDPRRENPFLYRPGDCIVFYPVSPGEYGDIAGAVENGSFFCPRKAVVPAGPAAEASRRSRLWA